MLSNLMSYGLRLREPIRSDAGQANSKRSFILLERKNRAGSAPGI